MGKREKQATLQNVFKNKSVVRKTSNRNATFNKLQT
jgi:hypothetical protein